MLHEHVQQKASFIEEGFLFVADSLLLWNWRDVKTGKPLTQGLLKHLEVRIPSENLESAVTVYTENLKKYEITALRDLRVGYREVTGSLLTRKPSLNLKLTLELTKV